jgi:hypothetical protein
MTTKDAVVRVSPSAAFRIMGPNEVEVVVEGSSLALSMGDYRVVLEFASGRSIEEVLRSLSADVRADDVDTLIATLLKKGVLSAEPLPESDEPLQTILHPETFRDPGVLPEIGRQVEAGRAVAVANAFEPGLAQRVHDALATSSSWRPYDGHNGFFQHRQHNIFGWANLPPEVREFARVAGSSRTKLLLSVLTGADCRGSLSLGTSMYLPGDYSSPHSDATDDRSIAYVWYLTKEWSPEWGGQFVWCPTGAIVDPSFNALILFKVSRESLHFVSPVAQRARGRRLSVNGWWTASKSAVAAAPHDPPAWPVHLSPGRYGAPTAVLTGRANVLVL